ncbi:restriction endonuclease subunit S [Kocuria sp. M1R5S2]|uniref:restriction endonuclease subunit S n=1 Tax=Kocuria rhizosphaerae TaxID=3376285 RepID=UPI00379B89DE
MFYKRFSPGHVLYVSRRTYLRKVAVPHFEGITGEKTFVLETTNPGIMLQEFLPFVLTTERFHEYAISNSRGSVNPYLNWGELAAYKFNLPPLGEQQRIANLLWALENCDQGVWQVAGRGIEVAESIRSKFMGHYGRPVAASDAFDIIIGRQRAPKHEKGDHLVPYLRSANVTSTGVSLDDVKSMNFTPTEQAKFALEPGDVLVSEGSASATAVGMPAVWKGEMEGTVCFQNTLLRYRAIEGVTLPGFVEHWCRWAFETGRFLRAASGTNIHHIGSGGAAAMEVRLPTIEEQEAFLGRVNSADRVTADALREAAKLGNLRKALFADVFGGR